MKPYSFFGNTELLYRLNPYVLLIRNHLFDLESEPIIRLTYFNLTPTILFKKSSLSFVGQNKLRKNSKEFLFIQFDDDKCILQPQWDQCQFSIIDILKKLDLRIIKSIIICTKVSSCSFSSLDKINIELHIGYYKSDDLITLVGETDIGNNVILTFSEVISALIEEDINYYSVISSLSDITQKIVFSIYVKGFQELILKNNKSCIVLVFDKLRVEVQKTKISIIISIYVDNCFIRLRASYTCDSPIMEIVDFQGTMYELNSMVDNFIESWKDDKFVKLP